METASVVRKMWPSKLPICLSLLMTRAATAVAALTTTSAIRMRPVMEPKVTW